MKRSLPIKTLSDRPRSMLSRDFLDLFDWLLTLLLHHRFVFKLIKGHIFYLTELFVYSYIREETNVLLFKESSYVFISFLILPDLL